MAFQIPVLPFLCIIFFLFVSSAKGKIGSHKNSSPFTFIKHLQGFEKGSKAKGLHDLKLYLARYGYLNHKHAPNHINSENHKFDEELEVALKRYQNFYRLNATGTLNGATVSQMLKPRCGQPDIKTHQHKAKSLHTTSHYKFAPSELKWPENKTDLTYAFDINFQDAYIPPVVRAFDTWASASGYFTFSKVDDIEGADLKISFQRGDHGDGSAFDGPFGIVGHAFYPPDGRLHFDADERWSLGPGPVPENIDLETVALHEIGHLLGLDHSQDENAIMWSTMSSGVLKGLNSDDIQGIKDLYGVENDDQSVSVPPASAPAPAPAPASAPAPAPASLTTD